MEITNEKKVLDLCTFVCKLPEGNLLTTEVEAGYWVELMLGLMDQDIPYMFFPKAVQRGDQPIGLILQTA